MAKQQSTLAGLYLQAYALGEELEAVLRAPLTAAGVALIEELVARRAALASAADLEVRQSGVDDEAKATLSRLLEQQSAIESDLNRSMEALHRLQAGAQERLALVQSAGRLLTPRGRSRLVDERR